MLVRVSCLEIRPPFFILICVTLVLTSMTGCNSDKQSALAPQFRPPGNGEIYTLDLNDDGVDDFVFEYSILETEDDPASARSVFLSVDSLGDNLVHYTEEAGARPLADSTLIDNTLTWTGYPSSLAKIDWSVDSGWDEVWSGSWVGVSEMNLGLEIIVDNADHFGWVRLSVDSELGTLTVHDYAYQPTQGEPILAGVHP